MFLGSLMGTISTVRFLFFSFWAFLFAQELGFNYLLCFFFWSCTSSTNSYFFFLGLLVTLNIHLYLLFDRNGYVSDGLPNDMFSLPFFPGAENMQRNCEASLKCLHTKGFPYNLQCNGNPIEGFPEHKEEISNHLGEDNSESDRPLGSEFLESPIECHNKPTYHHDFGYWSTFHFDSQKLQQCQMINAFESQFYPFPVDNRFHYVPFNVFSQSYPNELQFQDFQYFVVIDFEATCDKDRNPHPQEIIEFPSVIVSSVTGQLEACFQTYVRPTCNHLLSDFCKDLTGIQQIQVCPTWLTFTYE